MWQIADGRERERERGTRGPRDLLRLSRGGEVGERVGWSSVEEMAHLHFQRLLVGNGNRQVRWGRPSLPWYDVLAQISLYRFIVFSQSLNGAPDDEEGAAAAAVRSAPQFRERRDRERRGGAEVIAPSALFPSSSSVIHTPPLPMDFVVRDSFRWQLRRRRRRSRVELIRSFVV